MGRNRLRKQTGPVEPAVAMAAVAGALARRTRHRMGLVGWRRMDCKQMLHSLRRARMSSRKPWMQLLPSQQPLRPDRQFEQCRPEGGARELGVGQE